MPTDKYHSSHKIIVGNDASYDDSSLPSTSLLVDVVGETVINSEGNAAIITSNTLYLTSTTGSYLESAGIVDIKSRFASVDISAVGGGINLSSQGQITLDSTSGYIITPTGTLSGSNLLKSDASGQISWTDNASTFIDWSDVSPSSKISFSPEYGADFEVTTQSGDIDILQSGGTNGLLIGGGFNHEFTSIGATYINSLNIIIGSNDTTYANGVGLVQPSSLVRLQSTGAIDMLSDFVEIRGSGHTTNDPHVYLLKVFNTTGGEQADGILIDLDADDNGGLPSYLNNWIKFSWGGDVKGAIQGADDNGDGDDYLGFSKKDDGTYDYIFAASSAALTAEGNAQFVSGTGDFGEYFKAGDPEEWGGESPDEIGFTEEGMIVWVYDNKFYKKKICKNAIPMVITKRAIVIGGADTNGDPHLKRGRVLSFIGRLPIIVKGKVEVGDLIIPVDSENFCIAKNKRESSFYEYMSAIGVALSPSDDIVFLPEDHKYAPGEETSFKKVLCATGVK